ncbi:hypothetical protein OIU34_20595 [Pararhizobium sp. BT-229]|uniref:hypothetical protein n=1 Tax=Pararhizobium sp. BT-229 TaxID=2986923 RepID=UPI0021F6ABA7|nr:hypothetical protein [Pararhizobium sp. BT-229]MCV9964289.1 hypothetical protein [Pararhizobium sp. BT-229]
MKRYNLRLTGTIKTLSPIAIVPPNTDEVVRPDRSKYKRIASAVIYEDGLRDNRPVIPGSTLRGRLRRSAVGVYLALSGETIPLGEWHQNAVGGIKGAGSEDAYDVVMRDEIRGRNPILSLFGAGSPWIASKAKIDQAIPIHAVETALVGGVRADDGRRGNGFFEKLDDGAVDEWAAMVSGNTIRTKHKASVAQMQADLRKARKAKDTAEVARIETAIKAAGEDEELAKAMATNPVSMPLLHEVMPMGVVLNHGITLSAVTEEEIGLFFAAFNGFMKGNPAIGQHENLGYGLFSCVYEATIEDVAAFDPFSIGDRGADALGTITLSPFVGFVDVPERIHSAMLAFKVAFEEKAYDFRVITREKGEE